jgi:hypothetical protein
MESPPLARWCGLSEPNRQDISSNCWAALSLTRSRGPAVLIPLVASILCACWWTAEFTRSSLRDKEPVSDSDKGTSRLWDARHLIAVIGMAVGFTHI